MRTLVWKALKESSHPLLIKELRKVLNCHQSDQVELKRQLRKMVRSGDVIRVQGNRYGLLPQLDTVIGRFKAHRDGYGFVLPDPEKEQTEEGDVYINARASNNAMHGDRVSACIEERKVGGKREGRVVKILERAHSHIVGRFEIDRDDGLVIPSERRIVYDFFIRKGDTHFAEHGDIVQAEILSYPRKQRDGVAKVVRVLGNPDSARIDTEVVLASYGLSAHFPENVEAVADLIDDKISTEMLDGRIDHRGLWTVTIDGKDARDFDDAISIEKRKSGFRLWVHIADVAHYVEGDSLIDREAFQRGTSVYFPDKVLPMLPEKLSNGVCSLRPTVDRLTLTVEIDFDEAGKRLDDRIYESVIQSDQRMTYSKVSEILAGSNSELLDADTSLMSQLRLMASLAGHCREARFRRGCLDFDIPESFIVLASTGETLDIIPAERNVAHQIIEEFMLAANEAVAHYMATGHQPMIYRIHEPPTAESVEHFNELARHFGLGQKPLEKMSRLKSMSHILSSVKGRPEERLMNQVLLRTMKQARYFEENTGHFGLASREYTHFTSPIRRYSDLVVHRILKLVLRSELSEPEKQAWQMKLPEIARQASERERLAANAERELIQRKKVKFMADKAGKRCPGLITGLSSYGFFVLLNDFFVEGLVHVSSLADDYYVHDLQTHSLVGRRRHFCYRLGQEVEVLVDGVDLENWQINLKITRGKLKTVKKASRVNPLQAPDLFSKKRSNLKK